MSQIAQVFHEGGIFMYVIFGFFLVSVAFIAERVYALFFRLKPIDENFVDKVSQTVQQGKLAEASSLCSDPNEPIQRVAARGIEIRTLGLSDEELRSRMDEVLSEEVSNIDQRTGFLAMFGNVATLVGLLGTISGMIKSFAAVASANPVERSALLSKGIAEAMNCTAFGLLVAIPALVFYAILQNRSDRLILKLTESSSKIFHDLLFRVEPVLAANQGKKSKEYAKEQQVNH